MGCSMVFIFRDNPSEHKSVNQAELDIIHDGEEAEVDKTMPMNGMNC